MHVERESFLGPRGPLGAARPWNGSAHSRRLHQEILRLRRRMQLEYGEFGDPVLAFANAQRKQSSKRCKAKHALAQAERALQTAPAYSRTGSRHRPTRPRDLACALGQGPDSAVKVPCCIHVIVITFPMLKFEWDEAKDRAHRRKHGASFETANLVFQDPFALMRQDRVVEGELRWQAIGRVAAELVLVVAHTVRDTDNGDEVVRLISARKALKGERKRYEEQAYC